MSSPSSLHTSLPKSANRLTIPTRVCAILSFASLVLAFSVWFVTLSWSMLAFLALVSAILFASLALSIEISTRLQNKQRLEGVLSPADRQAKKIRKLRISIRILWIGSVVLALASAATFFFYGGWIGYSTFFYCALLAGLAWSNHRQLRFEMIDNARQREWIKATSQARQRNQVYWIALFALPVAPALWLLAWFSTLPLPLSLTSSAGALLWMMGGVVGAMLIDLGYKEKMEPPPPDCSSCDHEYDTSAGSIRCTKCGRDISEELRKWTHSTRPKRMFQLASAYILIAGLGVFVSISPAVQTVLRANQPTKSIIANLGGRFGSLNNQTTWTELMTRMPLPADDRQRLVDRIVSATITNHPPSSTFVPGINDWTSKALPKTSRYEESIADLLTYIDGALPLPTENLSALFAAAKIAYKIDLDDLPASQRDRAVRLAFSMIADKPISIAGSAKVDVWLYRAFTTHSLTDEKNERVLNIVENLGILQRFALGQLRPTTNEQRSRLRELERAAKEAN